MSAPANCNRHNDSGPEPDKTHDDYLESVCQRLNAENSLLTSGNDRLTVENNRLKATDQENKLKTLEAQLRNKTKAERYEKELRKRIGRERDGLAEELKRYKANRDEMTAELERYKAENEELRRNNRLSEDILLWMEVDPELFADPKTPDTKPAELDAEPMELDSEPEDSDVSEEL